MDILLVAGLWLDASVWEDVARLVDAGGHRAVPITLPGQGAGDTSATLVDQVATVVAAIDRSDGKPLVVGHSAACTLAWMGADARPDRVDRTVLIGGFPSSDGELYADFFPVDDGVVAFPGWEAFEGPDSSDLDAAARQALAARAIPVPEGVTRGVVRLTDERRFDVPVVLVCPEYTPAQADEWIAAGDVPELARARHRTSVDIASGHWPMITAPVELARILCEVAAQGGTTAPASGR